MPKGSEKHQVFQQRKKRSIHPICLEKAKEKTKDKSSLSDLIQCKDKPTFFCSSCHKYFCSKGKEEHLNQFSNHNLVDLQSVKRKLVAEEICKT